jgi:hypothetical protein
MDYAESAADQVARKVFWIMFSCSLAFIAGVIALVR